MKAYLEGILPPSLQDITVLPNAVDLERFVPAATSAASEPFRLVTAGRLDARKNQVFLVEVLRELLRRGVDVNLHILGDGPHRESLEALSQEESLQGRFILHGVVTDPEEHFRNATVYLHAARAEPFGLTLLEAMACGLPVVCLDGGGNRDFVRDGVNGYLLGVEDVSTFADRAEELLTNALLRSQLAAEALAEARRHGLADWADQLLALYSRLRGQ
jgi:glycosyltransferase involved in cell wall biosynthesis